MSSIIIALVKTGQRIHRHLWSRIIKRSPNQRINSTNRMLINRTPIKWQTRWFRSKKSQIKINQNKNWLKPGLQLRTPLLWLSEQHNFWLIRHRIHKKDQKSRLTKHLETSKWTLAKLLRNQQMTPYIYSDRNRKAQ